MQGIKKITKWNVQRSGFSTMALSTFCYPVPCKMFTSISGLSALDSRSALVVTNKKCPQTVLLVFWGTKSPSDWEPCHRLSVLKDRSSTDLRLSTDSSLDPNWNKPPLFFLNKWKRKFYLIKLLTTALIQKTIKKA